MKILIYGSRGWIASYLISELLSNDYEICEGGRADDEENVCKDLDEHKPTHVLSLIGRTHGEGFTTIDYLEQPEKLQENIRDNLYGPFVLAQECKKRDIHFTYFGTGCIFNGDKIYTEEDKPDFFGSSYSIVKGFTDRIMHTFNDSVLNIRIRMPITNDLNPRNFITKITTYEKVCSIPNSMSVLPVLLPYLVKLMEDKHVGTINFTNPGVISHNEILEMYKIIVDPDFTWKNCTKEEEQKTLLSRRSNNHLDTKKIEDIFPDIPNITISICECLFKMTTFLGFNS